MQPLDSEFGVFLSRDPGFEYRFCRGNFPSGGVDLCVNWGLLRLLPMFYPVVSSVEVPALFRTQVRHGPPAVYVSVYAVNISILYY